MEMRSRPHHLQDGGERLEVGAFRGDQWIRFEERHDDLDQLAPPLHREAKQRVAMVVVAPVLDDLPAPEHLLEEFERWSGRRGLGDENSCWTCQPRRHPGLRTTEIEKQPSPSTKPTTHCSSPGLSC